MNKLIFLNFKTKALLIIVSTVVLSTSFVYFAAHNFLYDRYAQIEDEQVNLMMNRVVKTLHHEMNEIAISTGSLAALDESNLFIQTLDEKLIKKNISHFLDFNDQNIDFIFFLDRQGKSVFRYVSDPPGHDHPTDIRKIIEASRGLEDVDQSTSDPIGSTFISRVDGVIILFSAQPIVNTKNVDPITGTIIMGRFLDANMLDEMSDIVQAEMSVSPFDPAIFGEGKESAVGSRADALQVGIETVNDQIIRVSVLLRDINGQHLAQINADQRRETLKLKHETLTTINFLIVFAGVLFGLIGWLLINYTIVSRVLNFSRDLDLIDLSGRMDKKLSEEGNDEITLATKRVNGLMARFETIIVDYRETRKELETSEREYRSLIENSTCGVFRAKADGRILFVNDGFAKIFEFDKKTEMLKVDLKDLVEDESLLAQLLEQLGRDGKLRAQEINAVARSGRPISILMSAVMDRDLILGNILDISEDPLVMDRLNSSEERYKGIIESSMDCICNISFDGKFLTMNSAGCRLNELDDPEELIGSSATAGILVNRKEAESAIKAASKGETVSLRYKSKNKIGREIWWDSKVTPVYDHAGNITSVLRISRDISDRLAMEEEVERARKIDAIGVLAGGIAHDFNNILSAILGNISLAQQAARGHRDEKLATNLESARAASNRAKDLTNQLLTFAKGGAPIRRTGLIKDLLEESALFITTGSGVKCEFSIADDLWPVDMDEGQINQVVNNLVINAVQSMESSGTIEISAMNVSTFPEAKLIKKANRFVKISITDKGSGIAPENMSKIFDPYFTTKIKGSGLGLSTCYSIIKNHDGVITVDSEQDKGTTFNIYLPASSKNVKVQVEEKVADLDEIKLDIKVLIMDDEPSILEVLVAVLEDMGCSVETALSGEKALSLFNEAFGSDDPFGLVITDLTVPGGFGGKDLLDQLKKLDPSIKAIVTSGYSASPIMSDHEKYGFSGVIPKPFDIDDIKEVVTSALK